MGFLIELAWATLMVGVPVCIFTLALVWWALQRGLLKESTDSGALRRELKAMSGSNRKDRKDRKGKKDKKDKKRTDSEEREKLHPLQKKWARFGGGFYGVVAFFTYIVIETREVMNTIMHLGGVFDFIRHLSIDVIVQMFVQAILNFVAAMVWPVYWMQRIETQQVWVWFVMAYAGYWAGVKLAQVLVQRRSGTVG